MVKISQEYLNQQELERQRELEYKKTIKETGILKAIKRVEKSEITILSRFIVILSIVADLFGLILVVGNLIGSFFAAVFEILYFFDGLGRGFFRNKIKKQLKIWILRLILYGVEVFGFGFSWLPLFTIMALLHYYFLKKGYYKKIEVVNNKMQQIKKALN